MSATRRTAVSYSRFSSPLQAAGDSEDRQEREYKTFCERHNLTPGKEVFADRGKSGYHGDHRKKGRLGQLIDAAQGGGFEPGTVVVIEAWDRLGRLRPDKQTELVAELLRTGVHIGICRLNDIFTEEDFGTHKWTTLAVFIQLAYQESKQKADRVAASWEQRRKAAREKGSLIGTRLPAWIKLANGNPVLIPERAAVVKRIFTLAAEGVGHTRIIRTLEKDRVPAFGQKVVSAGRTRSQFAGRWTKPYVALLLRDRRTVGEFQPMTKDDVPAGPPLVGYYPAAVSEDEFALARAAQEDRSNRDSLDRKSGPRQGKYTNVFKSMLKHARDDEGFLLHNKGTRKKPDLLLITAKSNGGSGPRGYTFPYYWFEEAVLGLIKGIDPKTILPNNGGAISTADVFRANLKNCREDIAKYKADLRSGHSKTLVELLREAEAKEIQYANELQDELARIAKPLSRSWDELPSVIDAIKTAPDPDAARLKARAALRAIVASGVVLIIKRGAWQFAVVQFDFIGGARHVWLIAYRPAANQREARREVFDFKRLLPKSEELDLRKPDDWKALERDLLRAMQKASEQAAKPADPKPLKAKGAK